MILSRSELRKLEVRIDQILDESQHLDKEISEEQFASDQEFLGNAIRQIEKSIKLAKRKRIGLRLI